MSHRKDQAEERAIVLLQQVLEIDAADRDALSGAAVAHVKRAVWILKKRPPDTTKK